MSKLTRTDLMSLEEYDNQRSSYRAQMIIHKRSRRVALGEHATLHFEDRLTMHYQVQEILRIEKIFEADAIEQELAAYNPLIPDGSNWKATFMIEYEDPAERAIALSTLIGVEAQIWVQIADFAKVHPIANEDLVRHTAEKTSAVHFLRFELSDGMIAAVNSAAQIKIGVDHPHYTYESGALPQHIATSLARDLTTQSLSAI